MRKTALCQKILATWIQIFCWLPQCPDIVFLFSIAIIFIRAHQSWEGDSVKKNAKVHMVGLNYWTAGFTYWTAGIPWLSAEKKCHLRAKNSPFCINIQSKMRIFGKIGGEVCFVGGVLHRGWGGFFGDVNVAGWTDIFGWEVDNWGFSAGERRDGCLGQWGIGGATWTSLAGRTFGLGWLEPKERAVSPNHSILGFMNCPFGAQGLWCAISAFPAKILLFGYLLFFRRFFPPTIFVCLRIGYRFLTEWNEID